MAEPQYPSKSKAYADINNHLLMSLQHMDQITSALTSGKITSLPEELQETYTKISFCDDQIRKWGEGKKTVNIIKNKYQCSEQMARKMMRTAVILFAQHDFDKDFYKGYAVERLVRTITALESKIFEPETSPSGEESLTVKSDTDKFMKLYLNALKELRETIGYSNPDLEIPDLSEMGSNIIIALADPEALKMDVMPAKKASSVFEDVFGKLKEIDDADLISE